MKIEFTKEDLEIIVRAHVTKLLNYQVADSDVIAVTFGGYSYSPTVDVEIGKQKVAE